MSTTLDKNPERIAEMFNGIAPHYDFLNHFLSLGFDRLWRQRLVRHLAKQHPQHILDVATGTGDLAILLQRKTAAAVVGIDIAENMLNMARKKSAQQNRQVAQTLQFLQAPATALPFPDKTFDAVTVAFGVRNFNHLAAGLQEMHRTLKTGGTLAILELTTPIHFPLKQFYRFYAFRFIPFFGQLFSKHHSAYRYLPSSVSVFPQREAFLSELNAAGFTTAAYRSFTCGVCCFYTATKK